MSRHTAPWQATGNAMAALLYPVENEREALRRQGLKPKDHAKENRRMIRDLDRKQRQEKEQPKLAEDPFKMARFKVVESQVRQQMVEGVKHESVPERPSTAPADYVRKGDGLRRRPTSANVENENRAKATTKPRVPTRQECRRHEDMLRRNPDTDYVRKNALEAIRGSTATPLKQQDQNTPEKTRHESYGRVPSYLLKRKEEMLMRQAAEVHRLTEHPVDCPDGMRLMKEEQRKAVLQKLDSSRLKFLKELASLPFVTDTPNLQAQKAAIEERLSEVDKAISIYSRPRVFIKA